MSILDNEVPYGILAGNHDMTENGSAPKYEEYFPASRYEGYSYWGGSYNHNKNNYQLFSAGGMDFIALSLEYCPPDNVLDWADNVLDNYSNRRAIISTHTYLRPDGNRDDYCGHNSEGCNGGTSIWDNLVVPHNNVFLVLNGHLWEEARRSDTVNNRTVHQLLSNYQNRSYGGNGWLRIMKFVPSEDKIYVRTYSPYLDQYETDSNSRFELSYPMGLVVSTLGAENVGYTSADLKGELENLGGASYADVCFQWRESGTPTWENTPKENLDSPQEFSESLSGLSEDTTYEFRAVADNSTDVDYGSILTFKTLMPLSWWDHRKEITIDHTKVDDNLDNFPILIDIIDSDLKAHAMTNGDDILFTKSDGGTKIPHEIELYKNSNGHLVTHVRIPYLSAVENTSIFMYYGNPGASNQENPTGVWDSNYKMVQHLDETPANGEAGHIDSTSNPNNGTPYNFDGTATSTTDGTGQIDGADVFDGVDDYVDCGNDASLDITDAITIEAWVKPKELDKNQGIVGRRTGANGQGSLEFRSENRFRCVILLDSTYERVWMSDALSSSDLNKWYYIAATYDGSNIRTYLNSVLYYTEPATGSSVSVSNTCIGSVTTTSERFNGTIDEVRISDAARSASWISTTFNNENSPSTFYSIGSEEIVGLTVSTLGAENVGYTSADVKGELENLVGATSADVWFQWRESGTPTWENTSKKTLYSPQEFSKSLSGLSEGTIYEFRAVADNSTDMDYGSILTFKTLTPWWDYRWDYRKKITINHTKVDDNLDNFPVLISITDSDLAARALDNGDDIVFVNSSEETKLDHEIENFDGENLVAWVRIPSLSASENTVIYMYYGNPSASSQENVEGVWDDNYKMVQHLEETSGTQYDSTNNSNDGTPYGSMNKDVTGKVDGADEFDGVDDYVDCGNDASLDITDAITIEAWVKPKELDKNQGIVSRRKCADGQGSLEFRSGNRFRCAILLDSTYEGVWMSDALSSSDLNKWYYIAATYDGSNIRTYLNGVLYYTEPATGSSVSVSNTHIGSVTTTLERFNGTIDEVRISDAARSASWISTTFNNENSPSTFYSVGSEEVIVRGVEVIIEPDSQPGVIGENVVFTVTVKNTGNAWDNYKLENNDDAGWTLKLDNDYLEIPWNENRETKLTVFVPDNENLVCTTDNITVVATAVDNAEVTDNDNATVHAVPSWSGTAVFSLVNLYTVNVEKILDLNQCSRLVVKFYTYADAFENENVIETFYTLPWHVEENENARHPEGIGTKKARLDLTTDNTENVISTIASFTVTRDDLFGRIMAIKGLWPIASPDERNALFQEIMDIKGQWPIAPS